MRSSEYKVALRVDALGFFLRFASPQEENYVFSLAIYAVDDCIGELFPTFSEVRTGFSFSHGEGAVEQQDALLSPVAQTSVGGYGLLQIIGNFFEDIAQRWGDSHS